MKQKRPAKTHNVSKTKKLIKISCITGIAALFIIVGILILTAIQTKSGIFSLKTPFSGVSWSEKLKKFDENLSWFEISRGQTNLDVMLNMLNVLEKTAVGAEGQLSVLKRRRKLANIETNLLADYMDAALRAAKRFPHSAAIAALAAESLVKTSGASANSEKLALYAQVLSQAGPLAESSSLPLAFCFYALSGRLGSADSAAVIEQNDSLFLIGIRGLSGKEADAMLVNAALLYIIRGDIDGAAPFLTTLNLDNGALEKNRDFFAEYSYDFGDPLAAARIWTESEKPENIARAADAFYIAGRTANALQLWRLLAKNALPNNERSARVFYNIAMFSTEIQEKRAALESMLAWQNTSPSQAALFGTVLYTRLVSEARGRAILEETITKNPGPLFELELFRRGIKSEPLDKSIADTWLLAGHYPKEQFIYRWAAWYFDFERRFDDTYFLLKTAEKWGIRGLWMPLTIAINELRANNIETALNALTKIDIAGYPAGEYESAEESWPVDANIGLILEARRDYRGALESFKRAAAQIKIKNSDFSLNPQSRRSAAARLELKMARCYSALGQSAEARQAVLNAAKFDADNINVRVALNRLTG
jgi:tetratricopeptide (TPR) repeat protein